jgi:hypothetical protein
LAAALLGAIALQWGSQALALQGEYALVVQGALLVVAVLLLRRGSSLLETSRVAPLGNWLPKAILGCGLRIRAMLLEVAGLSKRLAASERSTMSPGRWK